MKTFRIVLLSLLVVPAGFAHEIEQVTFDGPPFIPRGSQIGISHYIEAGMIFKPFGPIATQPPYRLARNSGGISGYPENGSTYIQALVGSSLEFYALDGALFDLVSVDLAEYSTVYQVPTRVTFNGFRGDGSIVSTTLTTDGVIDGTGPLPDFQTFRFGSEFSDLVRVEVPTIGYSLDNVVFEPVPEPATFWDAWVRLSSASVVANGCRRVTSNSAAENRNLRKLNFVSASGRWS